MSALEEYLPSDSEIVAAQEAELATQNSEQIRATLEDRRFDPTAEPPPLRPVYKLDGHIISTPGNLTTITSGVKTGKTAVIGAVAASAFVTQSNLDLLGFSSSNPESKALLWFDSEQSQTDFWHCVNRAIRRAGLRKPPPWLYAYCLTGLDYKQAWDCVNEGVQSAHDQCGGTHSILLDGYADFIRDVNDPGETGPFVASIMAMAADRDCPVLGIIHFNPGSDKSRGHLGSQLERKAETNLRLDKDGEVTCIWSEKQRRAPILKNYGPCFAWSNDLEMHVTVETKSQLRNSAKAKSLQLLAEDMFNGHPAMRYSDLQVTVKTQLTVSEKTARRRIDDMISLGVIKKTFGGLYEIVSTPTT